MVVCYICIQKKDRKGELLSEKIISKLSQNVEEKDDNEVDDDPLLKKGKSKAWGKEV